MDRRIWAIGGVLGIAACSSDPTGVVGTVKSIDPAIGQQLDSNVQHITVSESGRTSVEVRVEPGALCAMRTPGQSSAAPGPGLTADDEGRAWFTLNRTDAPTTAPATVELACKTTGGASVVHTIEFDPVAQMPAQLLAAPTIHGATRAALEGDPLTYSPAQLAAAGFPPRPDADKPDFGAWVALVSQPATRITSVSPMPGQHASSGGTLFNGQKWSNIWAGSHLNASNSPPGFFVEAHAEIAVASVVSAWDTKQCTGPVGLPPCVGFTDMVAWVGLDGDAGINDVIQAGTTSEWYGSQVLGAPNVDIEIYNTWFEWWPGDGAEINAPVGANDVYYVDVWASDANGAINGAAGYATFYIQRVAAGAAGAQGPNWFLQQTIPSPYSTTPGCIPNYNCPTPLTLTSTFQGASVEWIVEKPTFFGGFAGIGNGIYPLSHFTTEYLVNPGASVLAGVGIPGLPPQAVSYTLPAVGSMPLVYMCRPSNPPCGRAEATPQFNAPPIGGVSAGLFPPGTTLALGTYVTWNSY